MSDMEKVIKGLEDIQKHLETGYSFAISWKSELIRDAISLLKEQEAKQHISDAIHETAKQFRRQIVMCKNCKKRETMYCPFYWRYKGTKYDDWFCADGER